MKKSLLWIIVLVLSISMVAVFSFAGCKEAAPVEEAVEEEAVTEEEAPVEEAAPLNTLSSESRYFPSDDWQAASPEEQGIDPNILEIYRTYIKNHPGIHSILIIRHGYIIFEEYSGHYRKDTIHNIKSVSKSILSALTGIAIQQKHIEGLDQAISDFYPEYYEKIDDPDKKSIQIKHLLTMSAGFEWVENSSISENCWRSNDWHWYVLNLPLLSKPGQSCNYNTGLTHLLSGIIARATKMSVLDFADKNLFGPLGISVKRWDKDPNGYHFGGSELYLTPRDMAKFGYLYLNEGNWAGKQIVPRDWVKESVVRRYEGSFGYGGYGYLWWMKTIRGYPIYFASGFGGQLIIVVPDIDMVIVTTANCTEPPFSEQKAGLNLLAITIADLEKKETKETQ